MTEQISDLKLFVIAKNFMNPSRPLCAEQYEHLILAARAEKRAGIYRQGCGKIIHPHDWQVCECGGTLPNGEKRADDISLKIEKKS